MEFLDRLDTTIASSASSLDQPSALLILRMSGPDALHIALQTTHKKFFRPRYMTLSSVWIAGAAIDEALVVYFPGPKSATGEDVVEFHIHGNPLIGKKILEYWVSLGVKVALAGEFLYRSFWNNKYNLNQIEAIGQLLTAQHETALYQAKHVLAGGTQLKIRQIIQTLSGFRSQLESIIDFSDQDDVQNHSLMLCRTQLESWIETITHSVKVLDSQKMLSQGIVVALVGRPTAGKYSVLNSLVGDDVAIVHDQAGTTRDVVKHRAVLGGIHFTFCDTAGLRETACPVEQRGIEKTQETLEKAQVVVYLADDSEPLDLLWPEITLNPYAIKYLLLNKTDLSQKKTGRRPCVDGFNGVFAFSLKNQEGLGVWIEDLCSAFSMKNEPETGFLACARHKEALMDCISHAQNALKHIMAVEIAAEYLRLAQESLNTLNDKVTQDDILGKIFSQFCIGK